MIKSRDLNSGTFQEPKASFFFFFLKLTMHINDYIRAMKTNCEVNWLPECKGCSIYSPILYSCP